MIVQILMKWENKSNEIQMEHPILEWCSHFEMGFPILSGLAKFIYLPFSRTPGESMKHVGQLISNARVPSEIETMV